MMPPELCPEPHYWSVFALGIAGGVVLAAAAALVWLIRLGGWAAALGEIGERRGREQ